MNQSNKTEKETVLKKSLQLSLRRKNKHTAKVIYILVNNFKKHYKNVITDNKEIVQFMGIFFWGLILLLYLMKGTFSIDPDFGWELRLGEWMLKHGIPMTDPLSYTMPSYPYVNHEWLTSIILYVIHVIGGMYAIGIFFVFMVFTSIFLQKEKHSPTIFFFLALISIILIFDHFGMRAQVISWFFFSILLKILFSDTLWKRSRLVIPLFMLIWANMHGSFMLGLTIIILFIGFRIIRKKTTIADLVVVTLSVAATFVNPYGYRLWQEVWMHISDNTLRNSYGEWMPLWHTWNISTFTWMLYILVTCAIVFLFSKKIPIFKVFLLSFLAIASFFSIRQIPYFVITSLPLLSQSLSLVSSKSLFKSTFFLIFSFITVLSIFVLTNDVFYAVIEFENISYPRDAIVHLQQHLPKGHILSVYEWGGYLDWKLPSEKVFLDGRMDTWQWKKNLPHESTYIYKEDQLLLEGKISLTQESKKYSIDTLLFPVLVKEDKHLIKQIDDGNWKKVYQDRIAVIYQKQLQ